MLEMVDFKEDVQNQLNEDGVFFPNFIVDAMAFEFGNMIKNYERVSYKKIHRDSKMYKKILLKSIKNGYQVYSKFKLSKDFSVLTDDYYEESSIKI